MNIQECIEKTKWQLEPSTVDTTKEIKGVYVGDLLSWVMGRGDAYDAWVTVQVHMNVLAVAVLREFSCIVIADDAVVSDEFLAKAKEENIAILQSHMPVYETAVTLHELGI